MKSICFAFVGVFMVVAGNQSAFARSAGLGAKGGVNVATFAGRDAKSANAGSITGLSVGVFFRASLMTKLSLQAESLFSRKGAVGDTLGIHGTVELNYVDFPAMLRYALVERKRFISSILVGPYTGWKFSASAHADMGGNTRNLGLDTVVKGRDSGVVLGLEIGLPLERGQLTVETRYWIGMSKIDGTSEEADIKNRVLSILLGYYPTPQRSH